MLQEVPNIRQVPGEDRRRWFASDDIELTVWFNGDGISGFELCYGKGDRERAVRWLRGAGFRHGRVVDGEGRPGRYKSAPVLLADGALDAKKLSRLFRENSRDMDDRLAEFVYQKLQAYPSSPR